MAEEPQVRLSPPASNDLDRIWDYIARDNLKAADEFIDHVLVRCQSYAHQPELGEAREDLFPQCRAFTVGNYVVYYRPATSGMEVVRVMHGARHIDRLD